jgi:hypothetical protein
VNAYTVHLLAADGTPAAITVRAASVEQAETIALAVAAVRWPGRGWLVSATEQEEGQ